MKPEDRIYLFKELIEKKYINKLHENITQGKKRVTIDFNVLQKFSPELADDLLDDSHEALKAGDIALSMLDADGFKVRIRGELAGAKWRIRDLRSEQLNKLITIEGTIETKTSVHSKMTRIIYSCPACGHDIPVIQLGDELVEPTKCGCGRKGKFHIKEKLLMDCFTMRVQELSTALKYGSGLMTINVLCNEDLTDTIVEEKLIEGLRIKINGIYKEKQVTKNGIKQTQLITYIEANYIQISEETYYDVDVNPKDVEAIKKYVETTPNLISTIAESIFEGVYCDEKIKEALVLQAFGGVSNYEITPKVRGDIHILLVGDTGTNKSVYCEYVMKFSPKTVLAVGKTVSAVGLSGCPVKDELTGNWVLKPGAIPLANNATMIIDEFDKMKLDDRDIILEPMEQQSLTVSKANLVERRMLARESFLITMNPKNSFFSEFETPYNQIDLPTTIINRFDLIYTLRRNRLKSEENYRKEFTKAKTMLIRGEKETQKRIEEYHKFIRKYIAYVKQNIRPTCSKYILEEYLPEIYACFNHECLNQNSYPVSARHVWIIKRLAEARRKIYLGTEVTKEDIDYAMNMLKGSLEEIAIDVHTGKLDVDYIVDGVGTSKKKLLYEFWGVFDSVKDNNGLVDERILTAKLNEIGYLTMEIESHIENLKKKGDIFEPRNGFWKKL